MKICCYGCFFLVGEDNIAFHIDAEMQNTTTIVTAFFPFVKAKQSLTKYKEWLQNSLSYTENPMIIFTSKNMSSVIRSLRNNARCHSNQTFCPTIIITDFYTPWEMPPIKRVKNALISQLYMDAGICCIAQSMKDNVLFMDRCRFISSCELSIRILAKSKKN